jgi:hypothetical protein
MVKEMKVNQTNPQKVNPQSSNKGMEVFLQPPKKEEIQANNEKMKVDASNPFTNKTNLSPLNQSSTEEVKKLDLEEKIREIEQKLANSKIKILELSLFNKLAYEKKLHFKVLFVRSKIYAIVKDNTNTKTTTVAILPPRWGGTSLRYLITTCLDEWCAVVMKKTQKGEIYSYQSLNEESNEESDTDIFD